MTLGGRTVWAEFDSTNLVRIEGGTSITDPSVCHTAVPIGWAFDQTVTSLTVVDSDGSAELAITDGTGYIEFW